MKPKKKVNFKSNHDKNNNNKNETTFFRIIVVGDSGVGKTQLINIYNNKLFQNEHCPTFSVDFQIKTLNINGIKTNIHCIDTEGSKDFSKDTGQSFVKKADAFILVYDITKAQSVNNLYQYYEIYKTSTLNSNLETNSKNKIIYIVGNKFDLRINRVVNENDARDLAKKYNAKYIECSAKNGFNVDRLFEYIIQDILKRQDNNSNDNDGNIKNNNIFRNVMSIRSNDNLRNTYRNGIYTENESGQNFETTSNFLKSRNNYMFTNNNDYINNNNNINNYQNSYNYNNYNYNYDFNKTYNFYRMENKPKKCIIF